MDKAVTADGGIILSGPGRTFHASFGFSDDELDPHEVTAALELTPSKAWRRGDLAPTRRVSSFGMWHLDFDPPEGLTADEVLAWILDQLESRRDAIAGLAARWGGAITLSLRAEYSYVGIGFDPELLRRFAALNLSLQIGTMLVPDPAVFGDSP